jgi:uncharacterized membrane protein YoaK (UPF0700 family)
MKVGAVLAGVAGALNAAAFYALGFFAANMTGNASALADRLATGEVRMAGYLLMLVLVFVFGAMMSALLINSGQRTQVNGVYAWIVMIEAVLMIGLGCADIWLSHALRLAMVLPALSFLMGMQNSVVTRISGARVRTTHISGMVTDIGIELAGLIEQWRGKTDAASAADNRTRLGLHATIVASFLAGGVLGVLIYRSVGGWLIVLLGIILAGVSAINLRHAQHI